MTNELFLSTLQRNDRDSLSALFDAIRAGRRQTVVDLDTVVQSRTLRAVRAREQMRQAGLRMMCRGPVPTAYGQPSTSKATCDADVVTL
jgi:hypothetical protein